MINMHGWSSIHEAVDVHTAVGAHLDAIGRAVHIYRHGRDSGDARYDEPWESDTAYRSRILERIGTAPKVLTREDVRALLEEGSQASVLREKELRRKHAAYLRAHNIKKNT